MTDQSDLELVAAYVRGEMDDNQAELFELAMLENPELADRVLEEQVLSLGVKAQSNKTWSQRTLVQRFSGLFANPWVGMLATASTVVLAVMLTTSQPAGPSNPGLIRTIVDVAQVRGEGSTDIGGCYPIGESGTLLKVDTFALAGDLSGTMRWSSGMKTMRSITAVDGYIYLLIPAEVTGNVELTVIGSERGTASYTVEPCTS